MAYTMTQLLKQKRTGPNDLRKYIAEHPDDTPTALCWGLAVHKGAEYISVLAENGFRVKSDLKSYNYLMGQNGLKDSLVAGQKERLHASLVDVMTCPDETDTLMQSANATDETYESGLREMAERADEIGFDCDAALFLSVVYNNDTASAVLNEYRPAGFEQPFDAVMRGGVKMGKMHPLHGQIIRTWGAAFYQNGILQCTDWIIRTLKRLHTLTGGRVAVPAFSWAWEKPCRSNPSLMLMFLRYTTMPARTGKTRMMHRCIDLGCVEGLEYALNDGWVRSYDAYTKLREYAINQGASPEIPALITEYQIKSGKRPKQPSMNPFTCENMRQSWSWKVLDDDTIELVRYKGSRTNTNEVVIPDHIGKRTVSALSPHLFERTNWDPRVVSLRIPGTVRKIPDELMVADWKNPFKHMETLYIGEGVEEIGRYAFWNCLNLKEIWMPSTMKIIGDNAFMGGIRHLTLKSAAGNSGPETLEHLTELAKQIEEWDHGWVLSVHVSL